MTNPGKLVPKGSITRDVFHPSRCGVAAMVALSAVFIAGQAVFLTGHAWGQSLGSNSVSDYIGRELQPRNMLANYDIENIGPLVTGLGFTVKRESAGDGSQFLFVQHPAGVKMLIAPRACRAAQNTDCAGVEFGALFSNVSAATVGRFNAGGQFSRILQGSNGTVLIQRYDIADYGIPEGNFSVLVRLFMRDVVRLALMTGGGGGSNNSVNLELDDSASETAFAAFDADRRLAESIVESHFARVTGARVTGARATGARATGAAIERGDAIDPVADEPHSEGELPPQNALTTPVPVFPTSFLEGAGAVNRDIVNPADGFDVTAFEALMQSITGASLPAPGP